MTAPGPHLPRLDRIARDTALPGWWAVHAKAARQKALWPERDIIPWP